MAGYNGVRQQFDRQDCELLVKPDTCLPITRHHQCDLHETICLWVQGLPDWAIKYAGGRVMGHSKVYKTANPPFWDWAYWGCYFWPGCQEVLPFAAEVLVLLCCYC